MHGIYFVIYMEYHIKVEKKLVSLDIICASTGRQFLVEL